MEEKIELKEKYLPIGSVVLLKDGEKKVMIISYLIFPTGDSETHDMFDYGGCLYPEGMIDSKIGVGFNHEDIAEVLHLGYADEDYKGLNDAIKQYADEFKKQYKASLERTEEKRNEN